MEKITVDDVEPQSMGDDLDRRGLTDPLGMEDFAMNYYALESGEAFASGLHTHLDQEEVFYVVDGTATFETKSEANGESETVEVGPHEAIRFAAGEFQQGRNEGDEQVVALALGAPTPSTDVRVPQTCPECGESDALAVNFEGGEMGLKCPECGAEVSF